MERVSGDAEAGAADWMKYDTQAASALLDEAGATRGPDGMRQGPDGKPLHVDIQVVSGWSDWVRGGPEPADIAGFKADRFDSGEPHVQAH